MAQWCHQCHCVGTGWLHDIQCQHRWNLQFLTTTCSGEAHNTTPWSSLEPSVLCTLSLIPSQLPKTAHRLPPPHPPPPPLIPPPPKKSTELSWHKTQYIQPYSKWAEVHLSLLRLEQYIYFPLFYARKQRKKNFYKNSCHSCIHATIEAVLNTEPR